MLSYRHSYHAGNFADVLKHIVQTLIIEALKQKTKPFVYFDTHAAAGRYDLRTDKSLKNAEFKEGIEKIWRQTDSPDLFQPYLDIIHQLNPTGILKYYPGSPLIAQLLMPKNSRLDLTDLHPTDFKLLQHEFKHHKNISIQQKDGYKNLNAKLPPVQRRALILIDPPYELKTEYDESIKAIKQAHRLFSTGIYALWFPIISRHQTERFCKKFTHLGIKKILRIELCIKQDNDEYGMTGSGMIIINPPWKLTQQLQQVLPWLTRTMQQDKHASYKIEWLVPE
ncbi:MAG: 23S rRNA (adenine(2030)-N(6))-methyltransferase RlmJ [Alcanivoracaceae bacterium]|nr:23S rRNA (adenine(2030)-N(6))-methyltransferase RlmJ [Alcanivoracaceae bacterium]